MSATSPAPPWRGASPNFFTDPNSPQPTLRNRRVLLISSFFRLVAAHETGPAFDAARVAKYDAIIKANINDFLNNLKGTFAATGQPTYLWYYRPAKVNVEEAMGVHGYCESPSFHQMVAVADL